MAVSSLSLTLLIVWLRIRLGNATISQDVVMVDDAYWINGAMAKACPSITVECLVEIIAFAAISISPVPGLRVFGQQVRFNTMPKFLFDTIQTTNVSVLCMFRRHWLCYWSTSFLFHSLRAV